MTTHPTRDSHALIHDAETLVRQLRSNADAHREHQGTERRRAADTIEGLLALAHSRMERALDAALFRPGTPEQATNVTELDGATDVGEPFAWPADAGQWAARWNEATPAERDDRVRRIIANAEAANECFVMNHAAQMRELENARITLREDQAYIRRVEAERDQALAALAARPDVTPNPTAGRVTLATGTYEAREHPDGICDHDGAPWPCPTVAAVVSALDGSAT